MTAQGKVNASKVQIGDRIIVKVTEHGTHESRNKTGEGVQVARVIGKSYAHNHSGFRQAGRYIIETSVGSFEAAPIQTMWLAPEDNAGIKRAHAEALIEDNDRAVEQAKAEINQVAVEMQDAYQDETITTEVFDMLNEVHAAAMICVRRSFGQPSMGKLALSHLKYIRTTVARATAARQAVPAFPNDSRRAAPGERVMTALDEPGWRVGTSVRTTEAPTEPITGAIVNPLVRAEMQDASPVAEDRKSRTGGDVVRLLEKVWTRIREDHPELPEVVIVTGSGLLGGSSKWGHFRPEGWKDGGAGRHELFLAGEALAKGAVQTLQTMLHEAAHTLAAVRNIKDTSRQGRWHNQAFRKMAEVMGLEHKAEAADKGHGYSFVTLTEATRARYADLLAELDREIGLTCHLPSWLGGEGQDGEQITGKPKKTTEPSRSNVKAVCGCEVPRIIRVSRAVLEADGIGCRACGQDFEAA